MPSPTVSPLYSTLELVRHDATAEAPERDHPVIAPENDRQLDALQTAPALDPETFYSNTPLEAVADTEHNNKARTTSLSIAQPSRLPPRLIVAISVIAAAVLVTTAIGLGLGLGLKSYNGSQSTTAAMTITRTALSRPTPSVAPPTTGKQILSDTSLAALTLPNGDRRLFFQENSGSIRHGYYTASTKSWRADLSYVVASDAKNHTPIAVVDAPSGGELAVFYVSYPNTLACVQFHDSIWTEWDQNSFTNLSEYTTAASSRHLSVRVVYNETLLYALLLYESSHGGVTLLNGSQSPPSPKRPEEWATWNWNNATSAILGPEQVAAGPGISPSAPFTAISGDVEYFAIVALKNRTGSYIDQALWWWEDDQTAVIEEYEWDLEFDPSSIGFSDVLLMAAANRSEYGFWVKGTKLTSLAAVGERPSSSSSSPFPFTRLAGFSQVDSPGNFFVYHQLNATTLAEDHWDNSIGGWDSNAINIPSA